MSLAVHTVCYPSDGCFASVTWKLGRAQNSGYSCCRVAVCLLMRNSGIASQNLGRPAKCSSQMKSILLLPPTKELEPTTCCFLTGGQSWLLQPSDHAVNSSGTVVKVSSACCLKLSSNLSLFLVWFRILKLQHSCLINSIHNTPHTPKDLAVRNTMHNTDVLCTSTSKIPQSTTQMDWYWS